VEAIVTDGKSMQSVLQRGSGRDDEVILLEIEAEAMAQREREKLRRREERKRKNRWSAGEAEPRAGPGNGIEQQKRAS
jgi:hypothetical protein